MSGSYRRRSSSQGEGRPLKRWLLMALVGLPLLCCGAGLVPMLLARQEGAFTIPIERASADARVKAALGEPVSAGFLFSGSLKQSGNDGMAQLAIPLSGSRQDGTLYVHAVKTSGVWGFNRIKVVANDGKTVSLVGR